MCPPPAAAPAAREGNRGCLEGGAGQLVWAAVIVHSPVSLRGFSPTVGFENVAQPAQRRRQHYLPPLRSLHLAT